MNIETTLFKDLLIINHNIYNDKRGEFREVYKARELNDYLKRVLFFVKKIVLFLILWY